eukprot:contig_19271_g4756
MLPTAHEGGSLVVQRFGQSLERKAAVAASQAAVATADQTPIVTVLSALAMLWSSSRATAVAAGTLPPLCSRQTGWHWTTEQFGKWEYTWHINLQPPDKLLYFLDHKYPTTNGFDWTALKGRDAALVNALHRARIPAATAAAAGRLLLAQPGARGELRSA